MEHHELFARIYREILKNQGTLPGLPTLALKLRKAVESPHFAMEDLARVVQTDPGATAYLMQMSNSPLYRTRLPVQDVKAAIRRFGIPVTRNLIMAYSARQLFMSNSKQVEKEMAKIWKQSIKRSAIASVLARQKSSLDPDRVLLASLMQDIGSLPILVQLATNGQTPPTGLLNKMLDTLTPKVSALLMEKWDLDDDFVQVASQRNNWKYYNHGPIDLVEIVITARLFSYMGSQKLKTWPSSDQVPAFSKFDESLDAEKAAKMMMEASREIQEVQSLLQ